MTDEHTDDTNDLNTTEAPEATIARLARELQSTRQQRDFLGSQLSDRITRFHAARVAHGDCAFDAAGAAIRAEIDALERNCGAIAQSVGVSD